MFPYFLLFRVTLLTPRIQRNLILLSSSNQNQTQTHRGLCVSRRMWPRALGTWGPQRGRHGGALTAAAGSEGPRGEASRESCVNYRRGGWQGEGPRRLARRDPGHPLCRWGPGACPLRPRGHPVWALVRAWTYPSSKRCGDSASTWGTPGPPPAGQTIWTATGSTAAPGTSRGRARWRDVGRRGRCTRAERPHS